MPHLKSKDLDMTKHSDYFVWKDTSECVARRCDTPLIRSERILVYQNTSFWRELSKQKFCQKTPENAFSDALLMSRFQIFANDGANQKNHALHSVWKPRFARF